LYSVTSTESAEAILRNGFSETDCFFGRGKALVGVWLCDRPLNAKDGVMGEAIVAVAFNVEPAELSFYKLIDDSKSYRQWCLPSSLIRAHGKISIIPADESERFWYLTDIDYLERPFVSLHKSDLSITDSIAAVDESQALLTRAERLLNGFMGHQVATATASVAESLYVLVRGVIERTQGKARAAFYVADPLGRRLHHIIGMPPAYARYVDGFSISRQSLACGLTAATGQPIITPDVRAEPRWKPWLWLAKEFDYRACWSFPVQTSAGKTVGTFAMYYKEPTEAMPEDLALAAALTRTAASIISRH
jgi:GAF domain-containing protein